MCLEQGDKVMSCQTCYLRRRRLPHQMMQKRQCVMNTEPFPLGNASELVLPYTEPSPPPRIAIPLTGSPVFPATWQLHSRKVWSLQGPDTFGECGRDRCVMVVRNASGHDRSDGKTKARWGWARFQNKPSKTNTFHAGASRIHRVYDHILVGR